jgi:hypothetical protein
LEKKARFFRKRKTGFFRKKKFLGKKARFFRKRKIGFFRKKFFGKKGKRKAGFFKNEENTFVDFTCPYAFGRVCRREEGVGEKGCAAYFRAICGGYWDCAAYWEYAVS